MARQFFTDLHVSRLRSLLVALLAAVLHIGLALLYSIAWVFPVPFVIVQTMGPHLAVHTLLAYALLWDKRVHATLEFRAKIRKYIHAVALLGLLYLLYPAYTALFTSQRGLAQLCVVIVPTLLKTAMKAQAARACRALGGEDHIPEVVNFAVELFHALFVTNCLQTAASPLRITLVMLLLDFVPTGIASARILAAAARQIAPLRRLTRSTTSLSSRSKDIGISPQAPSTRPEPSDAAAATDHRRRLLFQCEYYFMVEYIECIIPVLYGLYVTALYRLPNAAYYPHMQHVTTPAQLSSALLNIALFASLECVSLVAFGALMYDRLQLSCLHQLAFVLETQAEMVQMKLFTWVPLCLFFTLQHTGVDFTLAFAWVHRVITASPG